MSLLSFLLSRQVVPMLVSRSFRLAPLMVGMAGLLLSVEGRAYTDDLGVMTTTSDTQTEVRGNYRTTNGAEGTFKLVRNEQQGYAGSTYTGGQGLQVQNNSSYKNQPGNVKDRFSYTLTLMPKGDSKYHNHSIVITQTAASRGGNSELARQTLSYVPFDNQEAIAKVSANPDVPLHYNSMGDYFMGSADQCGTAWRIGRRRVAYCDFVANGSVSTPQLRADSPDAKQPYFYSFANFEHGYYTTKSKVTLQTSASEMGKNSTIRFIDDAYTSRKFTWRSGGQYYGFIPKDSDGKISRDNLFKSNRDPYSYPALNVGDIIPSGNSYVSYAVLNEASRYYINVDNAQSVTLVYEGIMKGASTDSIGYNEKMGETANEWLAFGIRSTPRDVHVISGKVFNDANKNGTSDEKEVGYADAEVKLVDCTTNTIISGTTEQTMTDDGDYEFVVPAETLSGKSNVCVVETNASESVHDTTPNKITVKLASGAGIHKYPNNNFGDTNEALLKLTKTQAVVKGCQIGDADLPKQTYSKNTLNTDSNDPNSIIQPNVDCVAYKIMATNTSQIDLENVIIKDPLKPGVGATLQLKLKPAPTLCVGTSEPDANGKCDSDLMNTNSTAYAKVHAGSGGEIQTESFTLPAGQIAVMYFYATYKEN